jgi:flagellar basal body rod protein FlgG
VTPQGVGPSFHALRYWERRQEVVAHNLANASTAGFRGDRVFARLMEGGGPEAVAATDTRAGTLTPTGRPLDVALDGEAFLVVSTGAGERYVRGGSFALDPRGLLVTGEGHPVLSGTGPLTLPPGQVVIHPAGEVTVDGAPVGRLRVERAGAPPVREGANLWIPQGPPAQPTGEDVMIRSGHLEESNVDPVSALVEMIEIQRAYGAVHRSLQAADEVMQTITSDLGRVGG